MVIRELIKKTREYNPWRRKKIKIVIVGNCQAGPIAEILTVLNPDIEVISIAIVHLLKSEQVNEYIPYFEEADLIITQLIADNYRCDFVRTEMLRNTYGDKLTTFINLFYSGYNPELIYMRHGPGGTLKGPLLDYHNKTFLDSWKEGLPIEETVSRYFDREYNKKKYSEVITSTMDELEKRESCSDIQMTDLIKKKLFSERLFFTFNHPCMNLMVQMCIRILDKAGVEIKKSVENFLRKEPLDKITVPVNIYSKEFLNIQFNDFEYFKGVECDVMPDGQVNVSKIRNYSVPEIVEKYYEIYDKILTKEMSC